MDININGFLDVCHQYSNGKFTDEELMIIYWWQWNKIKTMRLEDIVATVNSSIYKMSIEKACKEFGVSRQELIDRIEADQINGVVMGENILYCID